MKFRLVAGTAIAVLVVAANAAALTNSDGTAAMKLSTKKTGAPASMTVGGIFAPAATGAQRVLTTVTVILPPGTKLDSSAATLCPGDSKSVAKTGGAAKTCPADSQVGTGTVHVLLGSLNAVLGITIFNQAAGPTLDLALGKTPLFSVGSQRQGNRLTFLLTVAEQIQAKTTAFELTFDKPFVRTPSSCPASHRWRGGLAADVSGGGTLSIPASWGCR